MQTVLKHLAGWVMYFLITYLYNLSSGFQADLGRMLLLVLLIVPVYYGVDYILRDFLRKQDWIRTLLLALFAYAASFTYVYVFIYHALPLIDIHFHRSGADFSFSAFAVNTGGYYLRIWGYAILIHLILTRVISRKARDRAETKYSQLFNRFLGFQIHQHFINNALNSVVVRSLETGNHTGVGILEHFADLNAYSQEHILGGTRLVSLEREIWALKEFTRMVTLKNQGKEVLILEIRGDIRQHRVPPIALLTFADNILKHGELNERYPARMRLESNEHGYRFITRNRVRRRAFPLPAASGQGIGLKNMEQRFQALMPGRYQLCVQNQDTYFEIQLYVNHPENGT